MQSLTVCPQTSFSLLFPIVHYTVRQLGLLQFLAGSKVLATPTIARDYSG